MTGKAANIGVDNTGSVRIWEKGYSTEAGALWPCKTAVKALSTVAAALWCRVEIRKVTWCSGTGPEMTDCLSKAKVGGWLRWPLKC